VADAGQDEEAGAGKVRREAESFPGRQEPILLSPEDESRHTNLLEQVLVQYPSGTFA
jgi:hypothetical protein